MHPFRKTLILCATLACTAGGAVAQSAQIALGGLKADPTLPVEVTSDSLTLDQASGAAVFVGNVLISQGAIRLQAAEVKVEYAAGTGAAPGKIARLLATGGVTLATGAEAAEASEAVYTIDDGTIVMTGNVLLTQGPNTIAGNRLSVNLTAGTGIMDGRVKTVLNPGGN